VARGQDIVPARPTVVYLSLNRWQGPRQRTQHIAAGLSRTRRVIFVEPAAYSLPGVLRRRWRGNHSVPPRTGAFTRISETLHVYSPSPGLPGSLQIRWLNRLVHARARTGLEAATGRIAPGTVDVVLTWPPALDLAQRLRPRRLVFDCLDLFPAFVDGHRRRLLESLEAEIARCASVVTVTSRALERRWTPRHQGVRRIPNAVDLATFAGARAAVPAPEVARLPPPRLGYVGTVGRWLDVPLLASVARQRPTWSLVLIGPIDQGVERPRDVPNVHFLGERPYASLPAHLAGLDVLLIPFHVTDLTQAVNPIKFYEYCAAGRPIAATPIDELAAFGDLCHLGAGPEGFLRAVDAALSESRSPDPARVTGRLHVACANTWEERVATFTELLDESI